MKKKEPFSPAKVPALFGVLLILALTLSCSFITGVPDEGGGPIVSRVTANGVFDYEIDLGDTPRDVYFIFSTATNYDTSQGPSVEKLSVDGTELPLPAKPLLPAFFGDAATGYERIAEANRKAAELLKQSSRAPLRALTVSAPPFSDTVGDTETFFDITLPYPYESVATCRYVFTETTATSPDSVPRSLSIWVSDDQWHENPVPGPITQVMVDALAERFLIEDPNNDIYDWLTNILGAEWGNTGYPDTIAHTGNITILLTDIEGDDSPDGGIVGYFANLNNFLNSELPAYLQYSNERIMFTIDAPMYANATPWSADAYWPKIVFSTLAHEFQHMIHFYQKQIVNYAPGPTDVWIDEMCAQLAEDLLADKLQVEGPRGVDPNDGTGGAPHNTLGRIPYYNYYTHLPLITSNWDWQFGDALLYYSTVYAFGAWAARNYGGPEFLRNVVHNPYTDKKAVEYAAAKGGALRSDMNSLIGRWAVSVIGSNRTDMPPGYVLNRDDWLSYSLGDLSYRLGSINFFNYRYEDETVTLDGPNCLEPGQILPYASASTNTYYRAARGVTGNRTFHLSIPAGIVMHMMVQ